jgi:hypothetical protein
VTNYRNLYNRERRVMPTPLWRFVLRSDGWLRDHPGISPQQGFEK